MGYPRSANPSSRIVLCQSCRSAELLCESEASEYDLEVQRQLELPGPPPRPP